MKQDTKKNALSALLYIVLAIMIVSVVCISVISVAKKARINGEYPSKSTEMSENTSEESNIQSTSQPEENTTDNNQAAETVQQTEETEKNTENSKVDNEIEEILPADFTLPAEGYVSKAYDADMPVYSLTMEDYRIHDGLDIACPIDSEVYACADGTIESIYEDPLMGYGMTVSHGGGLRSVYLNLSDKRPDNLYEGASVAAGQVIGYVGDSALIECAEVPHLHFTMLLEDETVDALNYIEFEEGTIGAGAFGE